MAQIQLRRDTAANWTVVNPVLAEGELGLDTTNNLLYVGDGVTTFNQLTPLPETLGKQRDVDITNPTDKDLLQYDAETGVWKNIQVDVDFDIDDDLVNGLINTRRQVAARVDVSAAYASIWVGNTAPKQDPLGRLGWHFASDGDKIGWEIWSQDLNAKKQITFADLRSASLLIRNAGVRYPYFSVYTRRKNDGQDANAQYRSRYNYSIVQDDSGGVTQPRLLTTVANNPTFENIEHRVLTFDAGGSVGPQEPDEVVKHITVSSSSSSQAPGDYDFVASEFIVDTADEMFNIELRATPQVSPAAARMYYTETEPAALGRTEGDFWYDSANSALHVWTGASWTAL